MKQIYSKKHESIKTTHAKLFSYIKTYKKVNL